MATTIKFELTLQLEMENGAALPPNRVLAAQQDVEAAVQNRLFGEGFLPDDIMCDSWNLVRVFR